MTAPVFVCDRVSRVFGSGDASVVALHEVTCEAGSSARISVAGASGSGKSTLLHLLAGLDSPSRGTLEWPGLGGNPHAAPALVGVVFQNPSLIPLLTAAENVALPLLLRGASEREAAAAAADALGALGLSAVARQWPEELSGGQAQRVAVARVLAARPRLILADEPTGRLDQEAGGLVVSALLETADAIDAALVVATHDPHVTARFRARWRMRDGRLTRTSASGVSAEETTHTPVPSSAQRRLRLS